MTHGMLDVLRSAPIPSPSHLIPDDIDNDVFSTPPTTPMKPSSSIPPRPTGTSSTTSATVTSTDVPDCKPSLSRRGSRPSSLHLSKDDNQSWTPDVQLDAGSPDIRRDNDDGNKLTRKYYDEQPASSPVHLIHPLSHDPKQPRSLPIAPARSSTSVPQPWLGNQQNPNNKDNINTLMSSGASTTETPSAGSSTVTQRHYSPSAAQHSEPSHQKQQLLSLKSPCFVHSFLDNGASLGDWLKGKQNTMMGVPSPLSAEIPRPPLYSNSSAPNLPANEKHPRPIHHHYAQATHPAMPLPRPEYSPSSNTDSEDEEGASLTRQLAATAVGVREMSKQLGRARIRSNIQNVLIITKARDNRLIKLTRELALYLMLRPRNDGRGLVVYVDNQLRYSKRFDAAGIEREHPELFLPFPRRRSSSSNAFASMANGNGNGSGSGSETSVNHEGQLRYWTSEMCSKSPHLFDFVVTLGGDGTVLFTSWLFQRIVPPVLPFALGSLGFLTNFDFADHRAVMDSTIDNGIRVNLRMRFTCTVYRAMLPEPGKGRRAIKKGETGEIMMRNLEKDGWEALEGGLGENGGLKEGNKSGKDKEIMCFTTRPVESFEILNDLVVDRGPSPYMSLLELFGDEHHMTTVQADGLTISTPTGSTAYSLSAGGSLVHPEIPAILITPICPHTLSFRPMLLPDSMELRICVPFNSRSTAWASFDGRGRVELKQGDHIKVTASKYPFPTVCADKQSTDWFHAISRTLKWNERERQKSFVVVEEGPAKPKSQRKNSDEPAAAGAAKSGDEQKPCEKQDEEEDDEEDEVSDDEEEEEDKFDIDDSSAPNASRQPSSTDLVAMAKAQGVQRQKEQEQAREAAFALTGEPIRPDYIGSTGLRERSGTVRSGIETPDRFAGAHPHPPRVSPRHVSFNNSDSAGSGPRSPGEYGDRDHIHAPQLLSGVRSRIPRDRDLEAESSSMKTPTMSTWGGEVDRMRRSRSREPASVGRAFAVWGQDESDSNASDSDI